MSTSEIDYICVGVCRIDPESGSCLGCGRPPLAIDEPKTVFVEACRYPVASELVLEISVDGRDASPETVGSALSASFTQ